MKQVICSISDLFRYRRNSGVLIILALAISVPVIVYGQDECTNPPSLTLSGISGSTCLLTPVTLSGNTFGGSATRVTITENGRGSVVPSSANSSPFSFTYNPDSHDIGKVVRITVTTNNPEGQPCRAAIATYELSVLSALPPPIIERVIQPTCTSSTGSVELSGLPSSSEWIVTVSPGGMTSEGSGTSATIHDLAHGIYTFTVSVLSECTSSPSEEAEVVEQPLNPAPPLPGVILAPTCTVATGSVSLTGLPASGTWTLTRYPGTIRTTGTGTSTNVAGLEAGIYNFTITNEGGCISTISTDVTIPAQPPLPTAPVIGTIVQPTLEILTGSVTLTGLPSSGSWTIVRSPGEVALTGSGTTLTITELEIGTYNFRVRISTSCLSPASAPVIISAPALPEVVITDPAPVCFPSTVDLTAPEIKEGSTGGLIYTYWRNSQATAALESPSRALDGIYYIKGATTSGYFDIKPVKVTVMPPPVANAGPDQYLSNQFNTVLEATLSEGESGIWNSDSDNVIFNDASDPLSAVSNLSAGENILSWVVTNGICPADTDKVALTVGDLIIPTFISPNGDSKNEYFVISGLETLGVTELTVFDRKGRQIFHDSYYENKWNGVDYNDNPLINDTYFFVLRSFKGKTYSGYIVIRK